MINHNSLRDSVHEANKTAGWWTNIQTGESILETRNRPEMLCLIASELIEAYQDGFSADSHLPEFPAFHVEVADAVIRILDLAGADGIDLSVGESHNIPATPMNALMIVLCLVCGDALEGYRKRNMQKYHEAIQDAYHTLWHFQDVFGFKLGEVIDAKLYYNSQRQDHKIENRLKEDGKKL